MKLSHLAWHEAIRTKLSRVALFGWAAVVGVASFGLLGSAPASAQAYPQKPVRMVVSFTAGSAPDILGRIVSQKLAEALRQPVIVENRVGAGGTIGTEFVAKTAPDGHTLLIGTVANLIISPALYASVGYDPVGSFTPISRISKAGFVLFINTSVPASTLAEFIALAKSKPGQLNYASPTSGTPPHILMEMFNSQAGVNIVGINYKGTGAAVTAILAGEVQVITEQFAAVLPLIAAGKVRPLMVTSDKRARQLPDVPSAPEAGLPGMAVEAWFGVVAPRGTPNDIVRRLNTEIVKAVGTKELTDTLSKLGLDPAPTTPEEFSALIRNDAAKWTAAVKASGAKVH